MTNALNTPVNPFKISQKYFKHISNLNNVLSVDLDIIYDDDLTSTDFDINLDSIKKGLHIQCVAPHTFRLNYYDGNILRPLMQANNVDNLIMASLLYFDILILQNKSRNLFNDYDSSCITFAQLKKALIILFPDDFSCTLHEWAVNLSSKDMHNHPASTRNMLCNLMPEDL